jgi:hypothetical protein
MTDTDIFTEALREYLNKHKSKEKVAIKTK